MNIVEALVNLDTLDDDQWTTDGAPKLSAITELTGEPTTRKEIIELAPRFSRSNLDLGLPETDIDEPEAEAEAETDSTVLIEAYAEGGFITYDEFAKNYLFQLPKAQLADVTELMRKQALEIDKEITMLTDAKRNLKISQGHVKQRTKIEIPDITDAEANRIYIKSSNQQRQDKATLIRETFKGLTPNDIAKLNPRAPIDRAFARAVGRGATRPGT
tara:strand:+ start:2654 stop:3301 length:648 start_codon:yes stop_codon:yes gene_type:complete